eukprot:jgi/Bigna1/81828/fgenesh1_pg.84_\
MSVSQFLGKDDWKVSVQDGGTYLVSGNQTSNKDKIVSEKVKQLENHLKGWKGNLKHEFKKREEDMSKCETQLRKLENEIEKGDSDEEDDDEGLDGECEERDIIREIMTQRDILGKHRKKIKEITDMLEGRKVCSKLRDAREIMNGQKSLEVDYKLTMEQYAFKHIDTKFVLKYKFNDGKISVVSQLSDESVLVEGVSFTGHSLFSLRKCGDKATLVAVAQAEIQLTDSIQTLTVLGVAVGDGKLFAVGGYDGSNYHKSGEYLDLKNVDAGWKKLPDMNTEREGVGVAVGDGKLYAVGGGSGGNDLKSGEYLRIAM